jgi:fimbrial chaperone protein
MTLAPAALALTSVMIWPIDPVIPSGQHAAALWLENRDTMPVTIQVRVLGWSEADNQQRYENDQMRVAVSPPMTTVPPGKRQLIRLIRTADVAPGTEDAYRVFIDEVPQPEEGIDGADRSAFGVRFQMHYSIPLFVYGEGLRAKADSLRHSSGDVATPLLTWHLSREGKQGWLVITNHGPVHARLTHVGFDVDGVRADIAPGLLGYVLAGAQMRWPVPVGLGALRRAHLVASVNSGDDAEIDPDSMSDAR